MYATETSDERGHETVGAATLRANGTGSQEIRTSTSVCLRLPVFFARRRRDTGGSLIASIHSLLSEVNSLIRRKPSLFGFLGNSKEKCPRSDG